MPKKTPLVHSITIIETGATSPDNVSATLSILNTGFRLSYARIAAIKPFSGIPPGTLSSIAKSGKVPKVWESQLHIKRSTRPRFTGHKTNMESLADSTWSQVDDQQKVSELVALLQAKIRKQSSITITYLEQICPHCARKI